MTIEQKPDSSGCRRGLQNLAVDTTIVLAGSGFGAGVAHFLGISPVAGIITGGFLAVFSEAAIREFNNPFEGRQSKKTDV